MSKARKKTTKRKEAKSRRSRPPAGTETGAGAKDADTITPYPSVGDNPEFADRIGKEVDRERGIADQGESSGPGRPVGRPPGTGKHQKAAAALNEYQAAGMDEQVMAAVWRGVFEAAALLLQRDGLKIKDAEATALARPSCVLWGYYMPTKVTPEHAAWAQLGMALFGIVGSRVDVIRSGLRDRAGARPAKPDGTGRDIPEAGVSFRAKSDRTGKDIPEAEVTFRPKGAAS